MEGLIRRIPRLPAAVLYDLDGVLADSFEAWVAVLDTCRLKRGLLPLGPQVVRATWGQGIVEDCRTFFPGEDPRLLAKDYDEGFAREAHRVRPIPGAVEAVKTLDGAGIAAGLVTNSPLGMAQRVLEVLGLDSFIKTFAAGDEVPRGKPAPDLVLLLLDRLKIGPERAVLVGDTGLDIAAGRAAGVTVIGLGIDADVRLENMGNLPALLGV